jgi:hypothetical protein
VSENHTRSFTSKRRWQPTGKLPDREDRHKWNLETDPSDMK